MTVGEIVTHILEHVDAEVATTDGSQSGGMLARANKVHSFLDPFVADTRELDRETLLTLLETHPSGDAVLRSEIGRLNKFNDGQRLQLMIQTWVRTGDMLHG